MTFNGRPVNTPKIIRDSIDFTTMIADLREQLRIDPELLYASRTCLRIVADPSLVRFPIHLTPTAGAAVPVCISVSRNGTVDLEYDCEAIRPRFELAEEWATEAEQSNLGEVG